MADQSADITWRDDKTPVSTQFDDPYFSVVNGLAETRHVFLSGNDLPERFAQGFHIAELGFGTGLNALAAWQAWRDAGQGGDLHFTSFEAFPMRAPDMASALAAFPEVADLAAQMMAALQSGPRVALPRLRLEVVQGDARATLPDWAGRADAWFLDGFSPAKNPELWGADLMREVANHTAAHGTFATYTAAGFVRRGLEAAGFEVRRAQGFGRKRHMSRGRLA